jgi:hypothetical protein
MNQLREFVATMERNPTWLIRKPQKAMLRHCLRRLYHEARKALRP